VSKAALNALTAHARRRGRGQRHPRELDESGLGPNGHGGEEAPRTVEQGADTASGLASFLQRPDGPLLSRPEADSMVRAALHESSCCSPRPRSSPRRAASRASPTSTRRRSRSGTSAATSR
jgi:hypothetical protein